MSVDSLPVKDDVRGLAPLLNASNPKVVVKMFDACADLHYRGPGAAAVSRERLVESVQASLGTETLAEADAVVRAVTLCLRRAVYHYEVGSGGVDPDTVFPPGFHQQLSALVLEILSKRASDWRSLALATQPSMARLVDVKWRLNVKTGSDVASQINAPAVLVSMDLAGSGAVPVNADDQSATGSPAADEGQQTVVFELSRESLQIMLDGLGKIREQLSNLAAAGGGQGGS